MGADIAEDIKVEQKEQDLEAFRKEELVQDENDLYEEDIQAWVNAVVTKTDDPSTPAFTIRAVLLGVCWGICLSFANALFSFRLAYFTIPSQVALLLSYPIGIFMAKTLPDISILGASLNPGPFSVKEHALIYIIASSASSGGVPYGIDNVVTQKFKIYMNNRSINFWNALPWILGTQFIGYGIAGISRRYLVKPAAMVWPTVLPTVALLNSFHGKGDISSKKYPVSRYTFFWIAFGMMFIYQWIPVYFAPALAFVSTLCFFSNNRTVKLLGSGYINEGIGLFGLTFDWQFIGGNALYTPFWAGLCYYGGIIFYVWVLTPIAYYNNWFNAGPDSPGQGYLVQATDIWGGDPNVTNPEMIPAINSNYIYTRNGTHVKVDRTALLNEDYTLNQGYYEENKPFYLSAMFALSYFASFMNITAMISHVALWNGKVICRQFKEALHQVDDGETDELNIIMRSYKDIPDLFYAGLLLFFTAVMVLSGMFTPFAMPWWSSLLATFLGAIYVIPIGVIQAITGFQMGLNVLTEFLIGLLTPGDCASSLLVIQALNLLGDLKQGHYQHISGTSMFLSQMIGTFIGALIQLWTALWVESQLETSFTPRAGWDPNASYGTFMSAGGIWGAIGPARFFGPESPYFILMAGFVIGLLFPVVPWLCNRYWPSRNWEKINLPLLTTGPSPHTNQNALLMPLLINFVSNKLVFTYRREWWEKYNFVLGIALDSATGIVVVLATLLQFVGPDFISVGPYPLAPSTSPDYYCFEQFFNGTYYSEMAK